MNLGSMRVSALVALAVVPIVPTAVVPLRPGVEPASPVFP